MIRGAAHPRSLPFDTITRTTYSLFNNDIFRRMATSDTPEPAPPTSSLDSHLQDVLGDPLQEKLPHTFRLLSQNVNGISPSNEFVKWKEILQSLVTHNIDTACFSETNIEWRHPTATSRIPALTKRFFQHSRLSTTTSSIKFDRIYKPGGAATLITNEWTGRILNCDADHSGLGRWTTTTMTGKRHRKIAIISAYQVCKTSIHQCGFTTNFAQQWHLLRAQGNEFPDPRRRFWQDLTRHIRDLQSKQFQIILLGDFNSSRADTGHNPIDTLLKDCLLSDAIGHHHDCSRGTSYSRGNSIIDYCLISDSLLPSIRSCGYLPLHFFCYSDHRSLYVDFDSTILFGGAPPKISKPTARFVNSRDSQATSRFLTRLGSYWVNHSLRARINRLAVNLEKSTATPSIRRHAMKIDRDRTRGFLMAEKKCHRRERPPWSRALHRLSRQFRYWQITISDFRLKRQSYNALIAIEDELNWRPPFYPKNIQEAKQLLSETKTALRAIRKQADTARSQDLQLQAQEAELAGDQDKARRLRRLHQAETTHHAFLKLRRCLKSRNQGGVTKLELPINQPDGSINVELTEDPKLIEAACLSRNKQHFGQAQGTPFTIPPLSLIESSACGPISDAILEGRLEDLPFDTTILPEAQQVILEELTQCCPTMNDELSFDDFKRRFTIWREDTSTSPSGMYLGLYKALISRKYHDGLVDDSLLQQGEDIFMDIFILANHACRFGFAYDRWKEVVNCMINKKIDSFLLNQLRVIHLFEADYNLVIGLIFGRYMIHRVCDNNLFHPSQWGRPHRECEDVLMLKELTYQIATMSRTDIATFNNDASACYDRLVTRFALLCCRAHGVPEGPCRMTAEVLDNVIHKIKTAYGISEEFYVNHPDNPIHGVGQGSQDGPSLWGISSSTSFRAADRLARGITCVNPTHDIPKRAITHSRKLDGFIDDVTGWFNRMLAELRQQTGFDVPSLAMGMQRDATTWQTLLDISGGKLAVAKCLYYLGHWRWSDNGTPELTPATDMGNLITLADESGPIAIPHFDVTEAHLTLGVWKSPAGNLAKQFDHLTAKSSKWTAAMQMANLTRDEATLSFTRIYIPSLRYGLGTCFFPASSLLRIQRPAVQAILPKMGYNRHLPRAVVYGPRTLGALGLPNLIYEQGVQQILFIGRHLRSPNSPLRSLFQIGVEWFRMLAGFTFCPLAKPQISTAHIEFAPWFQSLKHFLSTINHSLDIPNLFCPRSLREKDQAIMELPTAGFSDPDLVRINRCRLYLQVHLVSEISSTDGTQLSTLVWRGQRPASSTTKLLWPRQPRPSSESWRLWRRFLQPLLQPRSYTCYSTSLPLANPLGRWFTHLDDSRQWFWFYSSNFKSLLRYDTLAKSYQVHRASEHRNRLQADADPDDCIYQLPTDAIPCEPNTSDTLVSLPSRFRHNPPTDTHTPPVACPYTDHIFPFPQAPSRNRHHITSWPDQYRLCAQWESSLLPISLEQSVVDYVIAAHCHSSTIFHCSDGSVVNETGSFGWAFGPNTHVVMKHSGPAFGIPMDSYLAESHGLLSSACFWFRLSKMVLHRRRPNFKIKFYCDNKSLVRRVNNFLEYFDGSFRRSLTANYDVVYLIACALRLFPENIVEVIHVKGHQDSLHPTARLSWAAQLIVIADREANNYIRNHPVPSSHPLHLPTSQIHLYNSQQQIILKRWAVALRQSFYRTEYESWLMKQFAWDHNTLQDVDFVGLHTSIRFLPTPLYRFVSKWINQSIPTRRRVHRYEPQIPPTCKSCPSVEESDNHLLSCPSEQRRQACAAAYDHIQRRLTQLHTEPTIHCTILYLISTAMGFSTCSPPPTNPFLLAQQRIGPSLLFLKGRWSSTLRSHQESFYRQQHRPITFSGDRWMKQTLSLIFEELHQIWQCRNTQTHGADQELQDKLKREQLAIRVHAIYNQIPHLLAHDTDVFDSTTPEDIMSGPTSSIVTWLRLAEPTLQRCLTDAQAKLLTNQTDIRAFFDEASYCDSEASDTSLSYDTLADSGSIDFVSNTTPDSSNSSNSSITSSDLSDSYRTDDSGMESRPSPVP